MRKVAAAVALVGLSVLAGCKCPPGTANLAAITEKIAAENTALRAYVAEKDPANELGQDPDGIKAGRNDAAVREAKSIAESCR